MEIALICVLLLVGIFVGHRWYRNQSRDNTVFLGFMILLISILYSVLFLDLTIGGQAVTLKKIERARDDISKITALTMKTAFVLSDGAQYLGGITPEHMAKVREYMEELESISSVNQKEFLEDVGKTISEIKESVRKRENLSAVKP